MKKRKVIIIDAFDRVVKAGQIETLVDMQEIVGGNIERGLIFENGDELYVNEEGNFGSPENFFEVSGAPHPYSLSGFIVGPPNKHGSVTDVKSTVDEIKERITFRSLAEVRAMLKRRGAIA